MKELEQFAIRLKDLRMEKGLSLMQLADEIGVSYVAISRWENRLRIPSIESLVLLTKYFSVSPNYLLGYEDY